MRKVVIDTPPKLTQLIAALNRLGDPAIAEKHANKILSPMITVATPARGHDIGHDVDLYAHPRTRMAGLERRPNSR
jgi:hypothetical protein